MEVVDDGTTSFGWPCAVVGTPPDGSDLLGDITFSLVWSCVTIESVPDDSDPFADVVLVFVWTREISTRLAEASSMVRSVFLEVGNLSMETSHGNYISISPPQPPPNRRGAVETGKWNRNLGVYGLITVRGMAKLFAAMAVLQDELWVIRLSNIKDVMINLTTTPPSFCSSKAPTQICLLIFTISGDITTTNTDLLLPLSLLLFFSSTIIFLFFLSPSTASEAPYSSKEYLKPYIVVYP